jgi:hypothetical protein
MAESYLETVIKQALHEKGLISDNKTPIYYEPKEGSEWYRRLRRKISKNIGKFSAGGLFVGGSIGYFLKETLLGTLAAAGLGAASFTGVATGTARILSPIDRFLYGNPEILARKYFRDSVSAWEDCYQRLIIPNKKFLDFSVLMAKTPGAVSVEFPFENHQLAQGIMNGKIADTLYRIKADGSFKGFDLEDLLEIMAGDQTIGNSKQNAAIKSLLLEYSPRNLSKVVSMNRNVPQSYAESLSILKEVLRNYELTLGIPGDPDGDCFCAQQSVGCSVIRRNSGINTYAYMGQHSNGTDFPRGIIKGNAGHSFMNKAFRGMGVVQGKAEHKFMEWASGGIGLCQRTVEGHVVGLDDLTWPGIAISLGGFLEEQEEDDCQNGMVVSLNRSVLIGEKPVIYVYSGGAIERLEYESVKKAEEAAGHYIREYIHDWRPRVAA